jgi:uncharacterized membrane protein (DUF485 family)
MADQGKQQPVEGGDLTPVVGGWTDVAPLAGPAPDRVRPAHERTADEERGATDWDGIAASPAFRRMIGRKIRFVVAATVFFVAYYFALPILVGWYPRLMDRRVWGPVNLAYLFALSQFFVAWLLAFLYVRVAARFDRMSADILDAAGARREA